MILDHGMALLSFRTWLRQARDLTEGIQILAGWQRGNVLDQFEFHVTILSHDQPRLFLDCVLDVRVQCLGGHNQPDKQIIKVPLNHLAFPDHAAVQVNAQ
jgi:hypothetical protein